MTSRYPTSFAEIRDWARANRVTVVEARSRFAQYGVLRAIAGSRALREMLVFKGGNALDFVWEPNRSTRDLDFSADMAAIAIPVDLLGLKERLKELLSRSLATVGRVLGVTYLIYKIEQQPPGSDKTFVTYQARIAYALQDDSRTQELLRQRKPVATVIPVDISLNEPICADERVPLDAAHTLRVSTVEDIIAEKLRALLQQRIRRRERRQDLLDIALLVSHHHELDPARIAAFLERKAAARDVPVSRAAFRDPDLARLAAQDYAALEPTTRVEFIPFPEALAMLLRLVETLPLPEGGQADEATDEATGPRPEVSR